MDNVINFEKKPSKNTKIISIEELLLKIYSNRQINNIRHELMMTIDKSIQNYGYEFKTAQDKDYTMIETQKFMLKLIPNYLKEK